MPTNALNLMIARGWEPTADINTARQNALTLQSGEMQLQDQQFLRPMKNEMAALSYFRDMGQAISWDNYPQARASMISKGVPEHVLPPPEAIAQKAQESGVDPYQLIEQWKAKVLPTADQKLKEQMQSQKLESAQSLVNQKIESAEKIAGEKISSADRVTQARLDAAEKLAEARARHAEELARLKSELKPDKDEATPDIKTFELTKYGKLVPDKRGSDQYLKDRYAFDQGKSQAKKSTVMPEKAMDSMNGALDSMRLIDEIASVSDEALGVPGLGPAKMWFKSKMGSKKAQLFLNNLRQLKINAQSLIKGIPSNFDVQTFINSLPREDDTPIEVKQKVETARKMLEDSLITGMQNYEKVYEIPEYMRQRYDSYGIKGTLQKQSGNKIGRFTIEEE